jgi:hypothetical protein
MKLQTLFGIMLLIAGAAILSYGGFSTTNRETVDLGKIQISYDEKEPHYIPAPIGWAVVAGGVILVLMGFKRR